METTVALVDTDVFSALYVDPERSERRGMPVEAWRAALTGIRVVISFQTRAEVLAGVRASNWGERRIGQVTDKLDLMPTVRADLDVIDTYATLSAACRSRGHALAAKIHAGDRWVAASAIAKRVPLLSGDGVFAAAPDLALLT